jgi:hypothetical protein
MAGKIFVSYRRDDDPSAAARVSDALASRFGKANPNVKIFLAVRQGAPQKDPFSFAQRIA